MGKISVVPKPILNLIFFLSLSLLANPTHVPVYKPNGQIRGYFADLSHISTMLLIKKDAKEL